MLNLTLCTVRRSQPIFKQLRSNQVIQKRFSGEKYYGYREWPYNPLGKVESHTAEITLGLMYWWIMWSFFTDWKHLVGHFPWPDARKWTDQHLGIPADEED